MTRFDGLFDKKRKSSQEDNSQPEQQDQAVILPEPERPVEAIAPSHEPVYGESTLNQQIKVEAVVTPAKSKDPNYQRSTVYLPKNVHQRLKLAAIQDGKEISEVIEELVNGWLNQRNV